MELVDFIRNSTGFDFKPIVNDFICTVNEDDVNEFINSLQVYFKLFDTSVFNKKDRIFLIVPAKTCLNL